MTRLQGRFTEDVKDFVLEKVKRWLVTDKDHDETGTDIDMVYSVLYKVSNGIMLVKEEAKWLETMLRDHLDAAMRDFIQYKRADMAFVTVDEWSIYSDAWSLYCRPGTYTSF